MEASWVSLGSSKLPAPEDEDWYKFFVGLWGTFEGVTCGRLGAPRCTVLASKGTRSP